MSPAREGRVGKVILWTAIAGFAIAGALFGWQRFSQRVVPVVQAVAPTSAPSAVDLTVQQEGDLLVLRWNPTAVAAATHGLLSVTDGDSERRIGLNSRDLLAGSTMYAPLSHSVSFQLSLYNGPVSGKGAVLFLARNEPESPISSFARVLEGESAVPVEKAKEPKVRRRTEEDESEHVWTTTRPAETALAPAPPQAGPVQESKATPPPVPELPTPAVSKPPAVIANTPPPPASYRITVTAEPAHPSRIEQVLGKVPFVKRIAKTPGTGELVKAVRKVEPQLGGPPAETAQASVEIQVDRLGKVKSAKLVDLDHAPGNIEWASLRAAKAWRFEPPKEGQSAWLVLTFHYEASKAVRSE